MDYRSQANRGNPTTALNPTAARRAAKPTNAQIRAKVLATTEQRAETLFRDGYQILKTTTPGVYAILHPIERWNPDDPFFHYTVNVIEGTCNCAQFANSGRERTCKHLLSTQELVFCGIAQGMPDEFITAYYDAEMLPNAHLQPEMDTTTDTNAEPLSDMHQPCPDCWYWRIEGRECFTCADRKRRAAGKGRAYQGPQHQEEEPPTELTLKSWHCGNMGGNYAPGTTMEEADNEFPEDWLR